MVSTPAFVAPPRQIISERANIAEKYVNMRTQSFTRTHARSMQQFLDSTGQDEEAYWARWNDDFKRSESTWLNAKTQIESDPNLNFMQKREALNRLTRLYPAWTMEQEERFIRQYGDPREVARGRLEGAIDDLTGPTWRSALRQGTLTEVAKTAWELHFYEALVNPRDGSVPMALDAAILRAPARRETDPPIGDIMFEGEADVDPKLLRARRDAAARVCPYCLIVMGRKPTRLHLEKCARDNGKIYEG